MWWCERQHSIIITINIYIRLSYDDEENEEGEKDEKDEHK